MSISQVFHENKYPIFLFVCSLYTRDVFWKSSAKLGWTLLRPFWSYSKLWFQIIAKKNQLPVRNYSSLQLIEDCAWIQRTATSVCMTDCMTTWLWLVEAYAPSVRFLVIRSETLYILQFSMGNCDYIHAILKTCSEQNRWQFLSHWGLCMNTEDSNVSMYDRLYDDLVAIS